MLGENCCSHSHEMNLGLQTAVNAMLFSRKYFLHCLSDCCRALDKKQTSIFHLFFFFFKFALKKRCPYNIQMIFYLTWSNTHNSLGAFTVQLLNSFLSSTDCSTGIKITSPEAANKLHLNILWTQNCLTYHFNITMFLTFAISSLPSFVTLSSAHLLSHFLFLRSFLHVWLISSCF